MRERNLTGPGNPCGELSLPPHPEFKKRSNEGENTQTPQDQLNVEDLSAQANFGRQGEDQSQFIDPKTDRDSRIEDPKEDLDYTERRLYRDNPHNNARAK